ncbi:transposase [Micromonospora chersina]|uniref:transposase n=1 Tax=Micromonospora chersina TaxID=47854 RepID=UPI003451D4A9
MVFQLHLLLLELIPGGAKKSLSAAQAKSLLARVRPRDAVGKARRRVAAELIGDLERVYQRSKEANKKLTTVDTLGLLCHVIATPANVQDQHVAPALLYEAADRGIQHIWADQGYLADRLIAAAANTLGITVEIVLRPTATTGRGKGFHVLPRRWLVERTFAWISRCRRCARDYERRTDHHETIVHWAAIMQMTRRLARLP